jgi:biopolymer transport protein ExbD
MIKKAEDCKRIKTFNDDSVLPLINIVFLLLIFFIVMGKFYNNEIKKTKLADIESSGKLNHESVLIRIDEKGQIFHQGRQIKINELKIGKNEIMTISIDRKAQAMKLLNILNHLKNKNIKSVDVAVKPIKG